jgi:hypothetical protein
MFHRSHVNVVTSASASLDTHQAGAITGQAFSIDFGALA